MAATMEAHQTSTGLYERPVRCRFCDQIFDFPTLTEDVTLKGVPVTTRICGRCLAEMAANEELHQARMQHGNRTSVTSISDVSTAGTSSHKPSLNGIDLNGQHIATTAVTTESSMSPEQRHVRLQNASTASSTPPNRSSPPSESRSSSDLQSILN